MFITLSTVNKKRGVQKLKSLDCVCDSQPFTQLLRYSLGAVKKKQKKNILIHMAWNVLHALYMSCFTVSR